MVYFERPRLVSRETQPHHLVTRDEGSYHDARPPLTLVSPRFLLDDADFDAILDQRQRGHEAHWTCSNLPANQLAPCLTGGNALTMRTGCTSASEAEDMVIECRVARLSLSRPR